MRTLILFSVFGLCGCTVLLAGQDISKMEAHSMQEAIERPYRVLGDVSTEGCTTMWESHTGIENNSNYIPNSAIDPSLLQLARFNHGEECDAVINIRYEKWPEKRYQQCSSPGHTTCPAYHWCYRAFGQAVAWLDKPKPRVVRDLPESAGKSWDVQYWQYDIAISKIGKVLIVKPTMDAIVSALRGKFVEADIPMSKWNPDWVVIVYIVAVDNQLDQFLPNLSTQNGQIYFDTSKVDIPQSLDWLYATLDCKSEKEFQSLTISAKKMGSKFFRYLETRDVYEKYKANFEKRLEKRFRELLKSRGKKEKKVSRRTKIA